MLNHGGPETHPVMRFPETRVVCPSNQLVDRGTVAVGTVKVSSFVEAEPKGVYLTTAPDLNARPVRFEPKDIAGVHLDTRSVASRDDGYVIEAVRSIDPSIVAKPKAGTHPVSIPFISHWPEKDFSKIRFSVPGGICEVPYVWYAPRNTAILVLGPVPGHYPGWNVKAVCEINYGVCLSVSIDVLKNLDGIAAVSDLGTFVICPSVFFCGIGILHRGGDPEPPLFIPGQIDRFVDHRFGGKELNLEAVRDREPLQLLLRGEGAGLSNEDRVGQN